MSKHTKGPWVAQKDPNAISRDDWCIGIESAPIDCIAVCSERNARLIAAAPDFYAMAEMVLAWWDKHQYDTISGADGDEWNLYDDEPDFVTTARAAKAKADGETT